MYTGVDPSRHGAFSFSTYEDHPDDGRLVTRDDVRMPALWNYLSAMGVPAVVLNVPVTYPAEPISGAMIPDYLAPGDAAGRPASVRAEVSDEVGDYRVYRDEVPRNGGFLSTTADASSPSFMDEKAELVGARDDRDSEREGEEEEREDPVTRPAYTHLKLALRRLGVAPADVYAVPRRLGVDDLLERVVPDEDVAPVATSVLGVPIPERMTGAVPPGPVGRSSERRAYGDVGFGSSAADEGNGVEDRLRDLGYV